MVKRAAAAPERATQQEPEEIPDWGTIRGLNKQVKVVLPGGNANSMDLLDITARRVEIDAVMKALAVEKEALTEAATTLMIKASVKSVKVGVVRVTCYEHSSSKLDKKMLASKYGTKVLDWLKACTKTTTKTTVKFTPPKPDSEGDEESED